MPNLALYSEYVPAHHPMSGPVLKNQLYYEIGGAGVFRDFGTPDRWSTLPVEVDVQTFSGRANGVWRDQSQLRALELGLGRGDYVLNFLERLLQIDPRTYKKTTFYVGDKSAKMLQDFKQQPLYSRHAAKIIAQQFDASEKLPFENEFFVFAHLGELLDDLPTQVIICRGGQVRELYTRPVLTWDRGLFHAPDGRRHTYQKIARLISGGDYTALAGLGMELLPHIRWRSRYKHIDLKEHRYEAVKNTIEAIQESVSTEFNPILKNTVTPFKFQVDLGAYRCIDELLRVLSPEALALGVDYGDNSLARPVWAGDFYYWSGQPTVRLNLPMLSIFLVSREADFRILPQYQYLSEKTSQEIIPVVSFFKDPLLSPWDFRGLSQRDVKLFGLIIVLLNLSGFRSDYFYWFDREQLNSPQYTSFWFLLGRAGIFMEDFNRFLEYLKNQEHWHVVEITKKMTRSFT